MKYPGNIEVTNRLSDLRKQYPRFIFESFHVTSFNSNLIVDYFYSAPPDLRFKSTITFHRVPADEFVPPNSMENLLFQIGLVELLSYWKATCSPIIEIRPGHLSADQLEWWKLLLLNGMGEYFYVNRIPFSAPDFITILTASDGVAPAPYPNRLRPRLLIPLGGGRDSAVAAKLIQESGLQPGFMILNEIPAALRVAKALGCPDPIVVTRALDPLILELNRKGFLNGHVPFSATLAFINAACLALYGYSVIGIANEKSSDEGNIPYEGRIVNHQYSKSSAFELSFNQYLKKFLLADAVYLSLVRPLYELQIGRMFARLDSLHGVVSSCNRLQAAGKWCGECPKCLSVFATTYPFVEMDALPKIFGSRDFFDNAESAQILGSLVGLGEGKPFECVATIDETVTALSLCVETAERRKRTLPPGLQYVKDVVLPRFQDRTMDVQKWFDDGFRVDRLPASIEAALTKELGGR
ncbi:MAG TPA: hypothetical protein VHX20_20415 [Terracidiphilus sp.]|jgi:hypothetical protein|nr:hypothetical protein [Terracidiphilus sp.]